MQTYIVATSTWVLYTLAPWELETRGTDLKIKFFVSDPGVLRLLPAPIKLANCLVYMYGKI